MPSKLVNVKQVLVYLTHDQHAALRKLKDRLDVPMSEMIRKAGLMNEIFLDDLRERVHRGLAGQVIKQYWTGGRPYGYRLKPVLHPTELNQYGQPARIGTKLEIDPEQASIVRRIFERFAEGASCRTISGELNDEAILSPGSTWKRKVRRCTGWMGSAVRVILKNPLYTGTVRWNVSQFVRDPDSEKYKRRKRPQAEWHSYRDEALRIISDELFAKVERRTRVCANRDEHLKMRRQTQVLAQRTPALPRLRSALRHRGRA